ncbi:MAG: flagellar type III secretion system pore protein FliP [Rhizobiaceae bacterium]
MRYFLTTVFLLASSVGAFPQEIDLNNIVPGADGQTAGYIIQLFGLLTVLAIAPGLLITVTSFTRFIVAFSILRTGIGLQTTPANLILISLALFMTFYVMAPVFERAWDDGMKPLMNEEINQEVALERIAEPFRGFMLNNVREKDLQLFSDLAKDRGNEATEQEVVAFHILVPAFMISEIRRGFEIGFLVVLPFLIIDLIVATVTMAMGMMMLPPTVIALPFKILFFILIDGWNLLVGSMIRSFL